VQRFCRSRRIERLPLLEGKKSAGRPEGRGGPSFAAAPSGKSTFQDTPSVRSGAEIEPIAFLPFHRHRHRDYRNEQIGACFATGSQSEMPTTALGG
jgi:hypothetical protein